MTEPDSIRQELSTGQLNAIDRLVAGGTDSEAAEAAGVTRQTVNGWRNHHPYFRAELNRRRSELWGAAQDRLRDLLPRALDVLAEELEGENGYKVALQLLRITGLGDGRLGEIGPTTGAGVVEEETRWRMDPARMLPYLPLDDSGHTITDEDRRAVREDMLRRSEEAGSRSRQRRRWR